MIKQLARRIGSPVLNLYWKLFQPDSYGVKTIIYDNSHEKYLLVRHSYGNARAWHLIGGGYNPSREDALIAAKREVREEISLDLEKVDEIGQYFTDAQGKKDHVKIFFSEIDNGSEIEFLLSSEIEEVQWFGLNEISRDLKVYSITKYALSLLSK